MPCKVCNDPTTVKAHLIPRAFYSDIKGDDQKLYGGTRTESGTQLSQSGEFDRDILCEDHERSLSDCDTYGVEWVRGFSKNAKLVFDGQLYEVPNPRPDLMLKFVGSVIWRHGVSQRHLRFGSNLGPWERQLRDLIFGQSNYNPAFMIRKRDLTLDGVAIDPPIIFSPHEDSTKGTRIWEFELGGFIWTMKLNNRLKGRWPSLVSANDKNPLPVLKLEPLPAHLRTGLINILANMWRNEQGEIS